MWDYLINQPNWFKTPYFWWGLCVIVPAVAYGLYRWDERQDEKERSQYLPSKGGKYGSRSIDICDSRQRSRNVRTLRVVKMK